MTWTLNLTNTIVDENGVSSFGESRKNVSGIITFRELAFINNTCLLRFQCTTRMIGTWPSTWVGPCSIHGLSLYNIVYEQRAFCI